MKEKRIQLNKEIIKNWLNEDCLTEEELNKIIHFCNGGDAIH